MGIALANLINSLQNARITQYKNVLEQAIISTEDIKKFSFFSDNFYTRNLIFANDKFELIALCWKGLQRTPIHDHNGSDGWLRVVQGAVLETIYEWNKTSKKANLKKIISKEELGPGGTSHVNDDIGVHSICNHSNGETITIHLYAPRILKCNYIDQDNRSTKERVLGFHSVDGNVVK